MRLVCDTFNTRKGTEVKKSVKRALTNPLRYGIIACQSVK